MKQCGEEGEPSLKKTEQSPESWLETKVPKFYYAVQLVVFPIWNKKKEKKKILFWFSQ